MEKVVCRGEIGMKIDSSSADDRCNEFMGACDAEIYVVLPLQKCLKDFQIIPVTLALQHNARTLHQPLSHSVILLYNYPTVHDETMKIHP